MRTAIGLIVLGLIGGVVPTGIPGITHAAQVLAGTAGALLSLVVVGLAGAAAIRVASSSVPSAPRLQRRAIASTQPATRSI
jgi:Zn-dependent alcohol dehydrogenase